MSASDPTPERAPGGVDEPVLGTRMARVLGVMVEQVGRELWWVVRARRVARHVGVVQLYREDDDHPSGGDVYGPLLRVRIEPARRCSWCRGRGEARVDQLRRPPCAACWGTGIAGRGTGAVGS